MILLMKKFSFYAFIVVAFSFISVSPLAHAGQAIILPDLSSAWFIPLGEGGTLQQVNLDTGAVTLHKLVGPLQNAEISAICDLPEGGAAIVAGGAVWTWPNTALSEKPVKLKNLPEGFSAWNISCLTSTGSGPVGTILLYGSYGDDPESVVIALTPGAKKFAKVFFRRTSLTALPDQSRDGRMFLGADSDLWEGRIDGPEEGDDAPILPFTGCRLAPLALANSDEGNSGSMGVSCVAVGHRKVYVNLVGRHMGAILAVTIPQKSRYLDNSESEHPELAEAYAIEREALSAVEILFDGGPCTGLAVGTDADGKDVIVWREDESGKIVLKSEQEEPKVLVPGE